MFITIVSSHGGKSVVRKVKRNERIKRKCNFTITGIMRLLHEIQKQLHSRLGCIEYEIDAEAIGFYLRANAIGIRTVLQLQKSELVLQL